MSRSEQVVHQSSKHAMPPRAGLVKRYVVGAMALIAIGCLATITLGGSTEDWGPVMPSWLDYSHGWPWTFAKRECPTEMPWLAMRYGFWSHAKEFHGGCLAGDLCVLLMGIVFVAWVAIRSLRRQGVQISLARAALWIGALCGLLSYLGWHQTTRVREARADELLRENGGGMDAEEYCGPAWCVRLYGNSEDLLLFHHVTVAGFNRGPDNLEASAHALSEFPYLRMLQFGTIADEWRDRDFELLLKGCERWRMEELYIHNNDFQGEALSEIHRCPNLKVLEIWSDQLDGDNLRHLARLPHLRELELWGLRDDRGLADLVDCKELKVLELHHCKVTDAGLESIAGCQSLEELQLTKNLLTERSINILKKFPSLKKVEIGPFLNRSEEDWSAIQEKLDALHLEYAWYRSS